VMSEQGVSKPVRAQRGGTAGRSSRSCSGGTCGSCHVCSPSGSIWLIFLFRTCSAESLHETSLQSMNRRRSLALARQRRTCAAGTAGSPGAWSRRSPCSASSLVTYWLRHTLSRCHATIPDYPTPFAIVAATFT
jgi:hypothetical protein